MNRILDHKSFLCQITESNKTFKGRVAIANNEEVFTIIEILLNENSFKHRHKQKLKQLVKSIQRGISISALKVLFFKNAKILRCLVYCQIQLLVKEAIFSMCDSESF